MCVDLHIPMEFFEIASPNDLEVPANGIRFNEFRMNVFNGIWRQKKNRQFVRNFV